MKKKPFTYRRACGISSLWRDGKTKPEWNQGRHDSMKQETHAARRGIPSPLGDREEVKIEYYAAWRNSHKSISAGLAAKRQWQAQSMRGVHLLFRCVRVHPSVVLF
jgi:hypothetical protein